MTQSATRFAGMIVATLLLSACQAVPTPGTVVPTNPPSPTPTVTATREPTPLPTPDATVIPTPPEYPYRLEPVGQIGGVSDRLALAGDIVFLRVGPRVVTVDVSDPTDPQLVGRSDPLPGTVRAMVASGDYALVADSERGAWLFASGPTGPEVVSHLTLPDFIHDVALSGEYALFAASDAGIVVVDYADPSRPEIIVSLPLSGRVTAIRIKDNYAFVDVYVPDSDQPDCFARYSAKEYSDFRYCSTVSTNIVDIGDEANPRLDPYGNFSTEGKPGLNYRFSLEEGGGDLMGQRWLRVTDIRNPSKTIDTALSPLPDGTTVTEREFVIRGSLAYYANEHGLVIYDLSKTPDKVYMFPDDPDWEVFFITNWQQVGWLQTDIGAISVGHGQSYGGPMKVVYDYLYTFEWWKVHVWSLGDPANPLQVELVDLPSGIPSGLALNGGLLLDSDLYDGVYAFLDLADPALPVVRVAALGVGKGNIKVIETNRLLYLADDQSDDGELYYTLYLFDTTDPSMPHLLGSYSPLPRDYYMDLRVVGDLIYIRSEMYDSEAREQVYEVALDISDPMNFTEVESPTTLFFERDALYNLAVSQEAGFAYLPKDGDLLVFSLQSQTVTSSVDMGFPRFELEDVNRGPNYVVDIWGDQLRISTYWVNEPTRYTAVFDISKPESPQLLMVSDIYSPQIARYGSYYYFDEYFNGVKIYQLVPNTTP